VTGYPRAVVSAARGIGVLVAALLFSTCQLDELVNPPESGNITVSPAALRDSAAVGSLANRSLVAEITKSGPGSVSWSVARAQGSAWLIIEPTSGAAPGTVTLTMNPTGLDAGVYEDTLVITVSGGGSDPTRVPVEFTVHPCHVTAISSGAEVSDSLTTADCVPPFAPNRFAKLYRLSASANDSVSVAVTSEAFDAFLFVDSSGVGSGTPFAQEDNCLGVAGDACLVYLLLPEAGDYVIEVTTAETRATGAFALTVTPPRPPVAPTQPAQRRANGVTTIGTGTTVPDTTVVLEARLSDPDESDLVRLEVEVQPVGTAFTGAATDSSGLVPSSEVAQVTVRNLGDDTNYHWRFRAIDETGRASGWTSFGANDEGATDFRVAVPEDPDVPADMRQLRQDGSTGVPVGGVVPEQTLKFSAVVSDADAGDQVRLEVEVAPVGTAFTNAPGFSSVPVSSGSAAVVNLTGLSDDTDYHWQARTIDQAGRASAWVPFGGNDEAEPDFRVSVPAAPEAATGLAQSLPDSTTSIAVGGVATALPLVVSAIVTDPDVGDNVRLVAEVVPVGQPFTALSTDTGAFVASGARAYVAVDGLADDTDHHWRVRALDETGRDGPWVSYGSNGESDADVRVAVPQLPDAPTALQQLALDGTTPLDTGSVIPEHGFVIAAAIDDPDAGDQVRLDAEVRKVGEAFTGVPTDSTELGSGARSDTITVTSLDDDTGYRWRVRTRDQSGRKSSWVSFGANASDAADVIVAVPAVALAFTVDPSDASAGAQVAPAVKVTALESSGLVDTAYTGSVSVTLGGGTPGAVLGGTTTRTAAVGVATFDDLSVNLAGVGYILNATATGLADTTSGAFDVVPSVAARLEFTQEPSATVAGENLNPTVTVTARDALGNVAASFTGTVDVGIVAGSGNAAGTLSGTASVAAVNGVATFGTLSIDRTATDYRLASASGALTPDTTTAFAILPASPATVSAKAGQGQTAVVGTAVETPPSVLVSDAFGNPVPGTPVAFVQSGTGAVAGSPANADANGIATVGSWTLGTSAGVESDTLTAAVAGADPVIFVASATVAGAAELVVVAGSGQSAVVATPVTTAPAVRVDDQFNNPVEGAIVTFTPSGSGTVTGGPVSSGADGVATVGGWTLGTVARVNSDTLRVSSTGAPEILIVASARAAAPFADSSAADVPNGTAGAATAIVITIRDRWDNKVPGVKDQVVVTVGGTNAGASVAAIVQGSDTTYATSYVPTTAGTDQVTVTVGGAAITGSPYASVVARSQHRRCKCGCGRCPR
jgi:hypothetical protein